MSHRVPASSIVLIAYSIRLHLLELEPFANVLETADSLDILLL